MLQLVSIYLTLTTMVGTAMVAIGYRPAANQPPTTD